MWKATHTLKGLPKQRGIPNLGASYGEGKLNLPAVERYDVDGMRLVGPHFDPSLFFSL
jgi:hypothetical protein